jgi:hypothetical protein
MIDIAAKRGELIKHLEDATTIADELEDGMTGYLIERATRFPLQQVALCTRIGFVGANRSAGVTKGRLTNERSQCSGGSGRIRTCFASGRSRSPIPGGLERRHPSRISG